MKNSFEDSTIAQAKTENELLMENPKFQKKQKKADKKRRRKYKFSDKKHSRAGIAACLMAIPAIAMFVIALILATRAQGNAGEIVGYLPFFSLILSTIGMITAGVSLRKLDTIYTFSWIGLVSNIVVWLTIAFVLVSGL